MRAYQKLSESTRGIQADIATEVTGDLDTIAREGARRMLASALEAEMVEFPGRQRYERHEDTVGYRRAPQADGVPGFVQSSYMCSIRRYP